LIGWQESIESKSIAQIGSIEYERMSIGGIVITESIDNDDR
jgi:hypothetical protein